MRITPNAGWLLLAAYLVAVGLLPLLNPRIAGLDSMVNLIAVAAGLFILIGRSIARRRASVAAAPFDGAGTGPRSPRLWRDGRSCAMVAIGVSSISPLAALIAGILILVMPRLLNYVIALYLILIGLIGVMGR
jgi:hypothetical protein